MMDDRGVIVRGIFQIGAVYSYEGRHYMPKMWREPRQD